MTVLVRSVKNIPLSFTRRQFTLDAALAILAGCVITVSDACGNSSTSSTAPSAATTPPTDITGVIAANHGHVAVITGAQITTGAAVSLNIQGTATHPHTVALTQADLTSLRNRQSVAVNSSTESSHSHAVTFTPV